MLNKTNFSIFRTYWNIYLHTTYWNVYLPSLNHLISGAGKAITLASNFNGCPTTVLTSSRVLLNDGFLGLAVKIIQCK